MKVWGSPWTAIYGKPGKAFQVKMKSLKVSEVFFKKNFENEKFQIAREELGAKWEKIPSDTDILV